MSCSLALPYDIPWTHISVSPDMMDEEYCNNKYPFRWRTSLSISAFEPALEDIPEEMCDVRISYLKVSCTITGYQPDDDEIEEGLASFPNLPTEALEDILLKYYACYGVLLNVAIFPKGDDKLESVENTIAFTAFAPGTDLSNPYVKGGATFQTRNQNQMSIVDRYPVGGDGQGELSITDAMRVSLPKSSRVEAQLVHSSVPVTMEAFSGENLVGSQQTGEEQSQIHTLTIEGVDIDRVVFKAPEGKAGLLELTYVTTKIKSLTLKDYPHIVSIEPQNRDLYQAATDTGEILTSSSSSLTTGKSYGSTSNTQTDLGLSGKYTAGGIEVAGSLANSWGNSDQQSWQVGTEASRERRETQSTTTQLSQMYNLLTAYHTGTNRAVIQMLARPHILQPTDHRTFVQGVRAIEGIQDFFIVVARPLGVEGLCIEATLDTGHFPEDVRIEVPEIEYDFKTTDFTINESVHQVSATKKGEERIDRTLTGFEVSGWEFDPVKGDAGRGGIEELTVFSDDNADRTVGGGVIPQEDALEDYDYKAVSPDQVVVTGLIRSGAGAGTETNFHRTYRVYLRKAIDSSSEPRADAGDLLVTTRTLCACFVSGEKCVKPVSGISMEPHNTPWIAHEIPIQINAGLINSQLRERSRTPLIKELLRKVQSALVMSQRRMLRRQSGEMTFLDTDIFLKKVIKHLPKEHLDKSISSFPELSTEIAERLGPEITLRHILKMRLQHFARKAKLSMPDAIILRQKLIGRQQKTRKH